MFDDIFKYLVEGGVGNLVLAVILYFIIVIGNKLIRKIFPDTTKGHLNTTLPLHEHAYFAFLEEAMYYKVHTFQFESKKKKEIFTVYLKIIYKTAFNRWKVWAENDQLLTMSATELKSAFLNEIRLQSEDWNSKAIEIGIPRIVITKFEEYLAKTMVTLVEEIGFIIDNPYYASNYSRISSIFNMLKYTSNLLIQSMKNDIDSLNGEPEKAIVDIRLLSIIL